MRERAWISRSAEATEALGEAIGRAASPGLVVALDGDLGAGKTCFVRGLARGLDVRSEVASPTYALMASHAGRLPLHHLDAWMEGRERAFLADGGAEWLDGDGVAAVEWASRVAEVLPVERLEITLAHCAASDRATSDPAASARAIDERAIRAVVRGAGERAARIERMLAHLPAIPGLADEP